MTEGTRTATFETRHADAAAAATVAAALAPDNTPQMHTESDGDTVRTYIERDTTGGLHASADDYLVNVTVADAVVTGARTGNGPETGGDTEDRGERVTTSDTSDTNDVPTDDSPTDDSPTDDTNDIHE